MRWAIAGGALVLLLCVYLLNHQTRALASARRDAEGYKLSLSHQIVADQESKRQLQDDLQTLLQKNAVLRDAVDEARAAAPGARVTGVASFRTLPVPVLAPQDTPPMPPTCEKDQVLAPDGMGGFYCTKAAQSGPLAQVPPPAACVLRTGDKIALEVDQVVLSTQQGNQVIAGVARALKIPGGLLAEGRFQSALSDANALAAPSQPRWGVELLGACAASGCGLGAGVLFPPASFWGVRVEARAGALLGPVVSGVGAIGLRF